MMSLTHAAIALSGSIFFLGESSLPIVALAIAGSQLPDLDTTTSMAGRIAYPVAKWIEERYPHRTITHSLWASFALLVATFPLSYWFGLKVWLALPLGHLLSCFSDTCTKEGVALFWPSPVRAVYGLNPRNRLRTGSTVEYWVLAGFIALSIGMINLQSSGGLMVQFNQLLGLRDGVEQVYNRSGSTHHIYVEVKGVMASDRSPIDGRFFLVGQSGQEFILQNSEGLYKTSDQVVVKRVTAEAGHSSTTRNQILTFDDDDLASALEQLSLGNQGAAIYLSGTIQIDEPDEVALNMLPGQFSSLEINGNTAVLNYQPIEKAISQLNGQYAIEQLTAKVIYPAPEL